MKEITPLIKTIQRKLPGMDFDAGTSLRDVKASLTLQKEYLEQKTKNRGKNPNSVQAPAVRARICSLFGCSTKTYSKIMNEYLRNRSIYATGKEGSGRSGNTSAKKKRLPMTRELQIAVREHVREKRKEKKRVTGRQIVDFFVGRGFLDIERMFDGTYEKKSFETAYRATRRWLERQEYFLI